MKTQAVYKWTGLSTTSYPSWFWYLCHQHQFLFFSPSHFPGLKPCLQSLLISLILSQLIYCLLSCCSWYLSLCCHCLPPTPLQPVLGSEYQPCREPPWLQPPRPYSNLSCTWTPDDCSLNTAFISPPPTPIKCKSMPGFWGPSWSDSPLLIQQLFPFSSTCTFCSELGGSVNVLQTHKAHSIFVHVFLFSP